MKHSPHLARLIEALRVLPGVGPKSAQRMAFHLLQEGRPGARGLSEALGAALERVTRCQRCRMLTEDELCVICAARERDAALLCAVASPSTVELVARMSSRTPPSARIASSSRTPSCSGPTPSSGDR